MANRRGPQTRPASSEEIDCWTRASESLSKLNGVYANQDSLDAIGRVNRLILAWPSDDVVPAEGFDSLKSTYKKLASGLAEIKSNAEKEARAVEETLERLDILIALRKASESGPIGGEKRNKRPRAHSPPAVPAPIPPQAAVSNGPVARGVSITVPARNSVGPTPPKAFSREPKARREALAKQLPLQHGRRVAFRQPRDINKASDITDEGKGEQWILAVVTRCINQDKNRYEVHDPEPQDDGSPGQHYNTTLRALIPLPDLTAPPDSASHLNAYPEFPTGSTVMALYPDTSCFYRAVVIESPKDMAKSAVGKQLAGPVYKLRFEDDNDQEHCVSAQWVVEWPGGP